MALLIRSVGDSLGFRPAEGWASPRFSWRSRQGSPPSSAPLSFSPWFPWAGPFRLRLGRGGRAGGFRRGTAPGQFHQVDRIGDPPERPDARTAVCEEDDREEGGHMEGEGNAHHGAPLRVHQSIGVLSNQTSNTFPLAGCSKTTRCEGRPTLLEVGGKEKSLASNLKRSAPLTSNATCRRWAFFSNLPSPWARSPFRVCRFRPS